MPTSVKGGGTRRAPGATSRRASRCTAASYGFAEAARLFWLALKEHHLQSDGWRESRLEPAMFYLRVESKLRGILVTHVDDIEGGVAEGCLGKAFKNSAKALEFATNHVRDFIFRSRASAAARGVSFMFGRFFGRKHENFCVLRGFRQQHDVSGFSISNVLCSCFVVAFLRRCRKHHAFRVL